MGVVKLSNYQYDIYVASVAYMLQATFATLKSSISPYYIYILLLFIYNCSIVAYFLFLLP